MKNQMPPLSAMQIEEILQLLIEASGGDFPHEAPCVCDKCIAAVPMVYRTRGEPEWIGRAAYYLDLVVQCYVNDDVTAGPSTKDEIN